MIIEDVPFSFVCNLDPEKGADGIVEGLMPQARYKNAGNLELHAHGNGPFCRLRVPSTFRTSGVYALVVNDEIKYIGECVNLSSRYNNGYGNISPRNCFKKGQETNCRLNSLVYEESRAGRVVSLWFCQTPEHKELEGKLLGVLVPVWNRARARSLGSPTGVAAALSVEAPIVSIS